MVKNQCLSRSVLRLRLHLVMRLRFLLRLRYNGVSIQHLFMVQVLYSCTQVISRKYTVELLNSQTSRRK
jgi:hypothetical protein